MTGLSTDGAYLVTGASGFIGRALCERLLDAGVRSLVAAPLLDPESPDTIHSILDHHHHLLERWAQLAEVVRRGEPAPAAREERMVAPAFSCLADVRPRAPRRRPRTAAR